MSEVEQQYMETSENGHEVEEENNEAGQPEEGSDENVLNDCGEDDATGADGNSQNGENDGGQIDASKGEEDAGWVLNSLMSYNDGSVPCKSSRGAPCFFVQPAFVGAICGAEGGGDGRSLSDQT